MSEHDHDEVRGAVDGLAMAEQSVGPLKGLRVIDLSRVIAGNMLTLQLSDLGAEVIKIESPQGGDSVRNWVTNGVPIWWRAYARNKKSVTLNLRSSRGMEILKELLKTAHVLVENFRPGTLEKMGLAPNELLELQPRLVIVRISGWGQTGPYRDRPGFGTLVEAYSGLAAKTGFEDRPPVLPNMTLADMITGLYGFGSVLAALHNINANGGQGQTIDLSLFDSMLSCVGPDPASFLLTGRMCQRAGSRSETAAPRNVYQTREGEWVALSATTQGMTERLFMAIDRPDLITDRRTNTNEARLGNIDFVDSVIQGFIGSRSRPEVLDYFSKANVTVGPVMRNEELLQDEFVRARQSLVAVPDPDLGKMPMHNVVPRFSDTPGGIRSVAPELGEHNQAVLAELGIDEDAFALLVKQGVVG
ncbi:MAG: CaiB/BaiF CoA transferase family protein [Pigmentiphaga sp.]